MKILLINREVYPVVSGGKEIFVYQLAKGLVERGYKVYVLSAHNDLWGLNDVEFVESPYLDVPFFRSFSFAINSVRKMRSLVREIDVINSHECDLNSISGFWLRKIYKKPLIVTIHRGNAKLLRPYTLSKKLFKYADCLVAVSDDIAKRLRLMGFENIQVIPAVPRLEKKGLEKVALRKKYGLTSKDFVIIFVGRLEPVKNPEFLIFALKKLGTHFLEQRNIKVIIVGEGSLRGKIERQIDEYGLAKWVRLTGKIPHEKIHEIYGIADLLVSTSKHEGSPLTIIEAFKCSVPVICPSVNGIRQVVFDDKTGVLYSPGDLEDFLCKLKKLINNESLRKKLTQNASKFVKMRFDYDKIINAYVALYQKSCGIKTA